ncbi:MAG TPA: hypothetical protein DF774_14595 [Rheinheimera sp.]|nr:hypothetical protein [Rheinheimera sp.]
MVINCRKPLNARLKTGACQRQFAAPVPLVINKRTAFFSTLNPVLAGNLASSCRLGEIQSKTTINLWNPWFTQANFLVLSMS